MKKLRRLLLVTLILTFLLFAIYYNNKFLSFAYPFTSATIDLTVEPNETTSILNHVLEKLNYTENTELSILDLKVDSINPVVNNNNNVYTYNLSENYNLIVECKKDDDKKIITDIKIKTDTTSGNTVLKFTNNNDKMDLTINFTVAYRVKDDTVAIKPGGEILVKNNDYVPTQGKSTITIVDETGKAIKAKDGVYTPTEGLNLTVGGNSITVNDTSTEGEYIFYYYISNNKSGDIFSNDEKVPAKITLTLDKYAGYKAENDTIVTLTNQTTSFNILENDILPETYYKVSVYRNYNYTNEVSTNPVSSSSTNGNYYYTNLTFDASTGKINYTMGNLKTTLYYRVYFTETKYTNGTITLAPLVASNATYEVEINKKDEFRISNSYSVMVDGMTYELCDKNGNAYKEQNGLTVSFKENEISILTSVIGEFTIYYRAVYNGMKSAIGTITISSKETLSETGFYANEDIINVIIGQETGKINFLENDKLPKLEEVENAVKMEVVIVSNERTYNSTLQKYEYKEYSEKDADEDGYIYPDREVDDEEESMKFSVRATLHNNEITASLFKQGKGEVKYKINYLNENNEIVDSYESVISLIPDLTIEGNDLSTKDEFNIKDIYELSKENTSKYSWQIVEGNYIEKPNQTIESKDGKVKLNKNAIPTDQPNRFNIYLDLLTQVSWEEVLSTSTCRLQNGNSDDSSKRILLYPKKEEAERIANILKTANYADDKTNVVEVELKFYHDDWQKTENIIHTFKRYVISDSGNYSLYCQGPPDQGLHGEKDQKRKIAANNVYYVDITDTYNNYEFASESINPVGVEDRINSLLTFNKFIYNNSDAAIYNEKTHSINWNLNKLYNGLSDSVVEYNIGNKKTYYYQYNLIYTIDLNSNNKDFITDKIYDTSITTLNINDEEQIKFPNCSVKGVMIKNPDTSSKIFIFITFIISSIALIFVYYKKYKYDGI